jgi:hypothetical protein
MYSFLTAKLKGDSSVFTTTAASLGDGFDSSVVSFIVSLEGDRMEEDCAVVAAWIMLLLVVVAGCCWLLLDEWLEAKSGS